LNWFSTWLIYWGVCQIKLPTKEFKIVGVQDIVLDWGSNMPRNVESWFSSSLGGARQSESLSL